MGAGFDDELADIDDIDEVVTLVEAELLSRCREVPDLACRDAAVQHAEQPYGERKPPRQAREVGLVDRPIGESVRLTSIVDALAEAAAHRDGPVEEDLLSGSALSRVGATQSTEPLEGGHHLAGLDGSASEQGFGVVTEAAGPLQEGGDLTVRQPVPGGCRGPSRPPRRWCRTVEDHGSHLLSSGYRL
ncbi:hypothetical protein [Raineyella fluvialis]|uniref:Uncharacterized protein n=1 Tax=Raineyella fluvialis TaxID=2662261 RepID=A0A5Q2FEE8_9ACTN|nr:hypothetical protein [Raineyella fluvialis]QGF23095.1 hypothetical protein Rai3103_04795 [Raineyella fluvialis]